MFNAKVNTKAQKARSMFSALEIREAKDVIESLANGSHFDSFETALYLQKKMNCSMERAAILVQAWNLYVI